MKWEALEILFHTRFSLDVRWSFKLQLKDYFLFISKRHNLFIIQETLLCTYYVLDAKRMKLFLSFPAKPKIVTSGNWPTFCLLDDIQNQVFLKLIDYISIVIRSA